MISAADSTIYEFDGFRIDSGKRLLLNGGGEPIPVTPKIFDTLLYLVSHNGMVLGKSELMSAIWPDTIVEENNLNKNISVLRHIFGESPGDHRFIVTVPGNGYKFVAHVRMVAVGEIPASNNERSAKGRRRELEIEEARPDIEDESPRSIAILPFRNLTQDSAVSFYEFSLADAVITELARIRSLIVSPSSVVAKYMGQTVNPLEIGRELKVGTVLSASFLFSKDRIRVTTQLIDVKSGRLIWGERMDAAADDIITVQDSITKEIVDGLQLGFSAPGAMPGSEDRATINPAAYEEYLRGRDWMRRYLYHSVVVEDVEKAIEHFRRALELDPSFALAHCALGGCYLHRVVKGLGDLGDLERSREALEKGLSLDPKNVEARVHSAHIYLLQGEKQRAHKILADLRHEAPHNPSLHYASPYFYRLSGDYENALHGLDESARVDPTSRVVAHYERSQIFIFQGCLNEATVELKKASAIDPNQPFVKFYTAVTVFAAGDAVGAADHLRELLRQDPRDAFRPHLAMCLSTLGKHDDAREQLTDSVETVAATDPDVAYWLASAYLLEKQDDKAFVWFERAISLGNENRPWFERNPIWKPMHDDTRFKSLMHQIGRQPKNTPRK